MKIKRSAVAAAATTALLLGLVACAAPDESPTAAADGTPEKSNIAVGILPLADHAAARWAQDFGFFEAEGLDAELVPIQGGPVGIQRVLAGDLDFTFSNSFSSTVAIAGGAPITTVVWTSSVAPDGAHIFVKDNFPGDSIADTDGITIATNSLNTVGDVTFQNLADAEGLDVTPTWVEVPFNEILAGIEAGSVDAGYLTEPFASAARAAGLRSLVDLTTGPNEDLATATYVAADSFVADNPSTTAAFVRAMYAAGADIAANEAEFRTWLAEVTEIPDAVTANMVLPIFATETDVQKLQDVGDIMIDQGRVTEFDASESTWVLP